MCYPVYMGMQHWCSDVLYKRFLTPFCDVVPNCHLACVGDRGVHPTRHGKPVGDGGQRTQTFRNTKRMGCPHLSQTRVAGQLFETWWTSHTSHPYNSCEITLTSHMLFCGAQFMMCTESQTVHDYKACMIRGQSHTFNSTMTVCDMI